MYVQMCWEEAVSESLGGVECDGSEDTLGMDNDRRWVKELTGRTPVVARRLTAKVLGVRRN